LTAISSTGGISLTFGYDGALPTTSGLRGPVSASLGLGYDNDFRVASTKVNGTPLATYSYDLDSLLVGAGALSLSRDPQNGLLTGSALGNVTTAQSYNGFGERIALSATYTPTAGALYQASLTRDNLGRIVTRTEQFTTGAGVAWAYGYDAA